MILIVDNYDSFTYNLVQLIGSIAHDGEIRVVRNDAHTVEELVAMRPAHVIISPGPGRPNSAGVCMDLISRLVGRTPILGVCLGHQCIAQVFGAKIIQAPRLMHGKTCDVHHDGLGVFEGVPTPFQAARYHSLVADPKTMPDCLETSAWTDQQEIMGLRHKTHDCEGIQFHPESFMTEWGKKMLSNFLKQDTSCRSI